MDKGLKNGAWTGPALYFDCGADDFLINANRRTEEELMKRGVPYEYSEFRGAHTWPYGTNTGGTFSASSNATSRRRANSGS